MIKNGPVLMAMVGAGVLLGGVTLPGCGGDARSAPEAVFKAKKEDIEKADSDRFAKEAKDHKGKARGRSH